MFRHSYAEREAARRKSALRPGVIPDQESFTGADLIAITHCRPKTLSRWRQQRLLPRVTNKGSNTVYDRDYVRRALAIAKAGARTAQLKRFDAMIPFILDEVPAPEAKRETIAAPHSAADQLAALVPSSASDAPLVGLAWQTIELLPGLELRLAASAPPVMRAIVREVAQRFGRTV